MDNGNVILFCLLMGKINGYFLPRHAVDKLQSEK